MEEMSVGRCGFCGLHVDLVEHGDCRAVGDKSTVRDVVAAAYAAGFRAGRGERRPEKPKPIISNRCPAMLGDGYQCVLQRGHCGDHRRPPVIPNITAGGYR